MQCTNKHLLICSYCQHICQVHNHLDYGMVERIRAQFDEINVSKSGVLSPEEFDMFLIAVNAISAKEHKKYVRWCKGCVVMCLVSCDIMMFSDKLHVMCYAIVC
jgi:hypothetical protein